MMSQNLTEWVTDWLTDELHEMLELLSATKNKKLNFLTYLEHQVGKDSSERG